MASSAFRKLKKATPSLAGVAAACVVFVVLISIFLQLPKDTPQSSIDTKTNDLSVSPKTATGFAEELPVSLSNPQSINELVEIESEYLRNVTLRKMLANANERRALELFEESENVTKPNLRHRLQRLIVQKLAAIDPLRAFSKVLEFSGHVRGDLLEVVFEEWSQFSLDDALSHARTLGDNERLVVLKTIYRARDDLSQPLLNQISHDLGFGGMSTSLMEDLLVNAASRSPEDSWHQLIEDPWRDFSQVWSLIDIGRAWIEAEGEDVLFQIAESIPNHRTRTWIVRELFSQMSFHDMSVAFDYARVLYDQTNDSIYRTVVARWIKNDPLSAFNAVSSLDDVFLRANLLEFLASMWALSDPHSLMQEIDAFPESMHAGARSLAIGELAKQSPKEAIKALALLPSGEIRRAAREIVAWWSTKNVQDAVDWIQNDPIVQSHKKSLLSVALRELVRTDLDSAMQIVLDLPLDTSRSNLEFQLVDLLIEDNRIEETLPLLPLMREGTSRFRAYVMVGINLIVNKDIDRALELSEQLAESQRKEYVTQLMNAWARNDAQRLFLSLDELRGEEMKSLALTALHSNKENLNEEQIEHINSLRAQNASGASTLQDFFDQVYRVK